MKKFVKCAAMGMAVVGMLTMTGYANAAFPADISESETTETSYLTENRTAVSQELHTQLVTYLYQTAGGVEGLNMTDGFAGMYTDQNGTLCIGVTAESSKGIQNILQNIPYDTLISRSVEECSQTACNGLAEQSFHKMSTAEQERLVEDCLQIVKMTYSYAYLKNMQVALREPFLELKILETSVAEEENRLEIHVRDANDCAGIVNWLSQNYENFDENALMFVMDETEPEETFMPYSVLPDITPNANKSYEYVCPGTGVFNPIYSESEYGYGGTLGFCARDRETGEYGVITNAHIFGSFRKLYDKNYNLYGTVSKYQFGNHLDAVFVPYADTRAWSSSYWLLEKFGTPVYRVAATDEYDERNGGYIRTIYKYGDTTGVTQGTTINGSTDYNNNGTVFTDVVKYNCTRAGGDSGGPVFIKDSKGNYLLIGIHAGGSGNVGYAIKIEHILEEFSLEEYVVYRRGDVNYDRKVDSGDANLVLQYAAEMISFTTEQMKLADVNFDGCVDSGDALVLLRRVSE